MNLESRIWARIIKKDPDECWFCAGAKNNNGYPTIKHQRKSYLVTRLLYKIVFECDPGNQEVTHTCDHPWCCNPKHFKLRPHAENMQDCADKGRLNVQVDSTHV